MEEEVFTPISAGHTKSAQNIGPHPQRLCSHQVIANGFQDCLAPKRINKTWVISKQGLCSIGRSRTCHSLFFLLFFRCIWNWVSICYVWQTHSHPKYCRFVSGHTHQNTSKYDPLGILLRQFWILREGVNLRLLDAFCPFKIYFRCHLQYW